MLERVLDNLESSLVTYPRNVLVIYVNPTCRDSFLARGYREIAYEPHELSIFQRTSGDSTARREKVASSSIEQTELSANS